MNKSITQERHGSAMSLNVLLRLRPVGILRFLLKLDGSLDEYCQQPQMPKYCYAPTSHHGCLTYRPPEEETWDDATSSPDSCFRFLFLWAIGIREASGKPIRKYASIDPKHLDTTWPTQEPFQAHEAPPRHPIKNCTPLEGILI